MTDCKLHAEKLISEYRKRRAAVIIKRQKLSSRDSSSEISKADRYREGLAALSENLITTLEQYRDSFNQATPEVQCSLKVISRFPDDLEIIFSLKKYSLRFISRSANARELFQGTLIDGMLHCESTYKGSDRKLEVKAGLWGDINNDAWGLNDESDQFLSFFDDLLPEVIESLWKRATLGLIHSG